MFKKMFLIIICILLFSSCSNTKLNTPPPNVVSDKDKAGEGTTKDPAIPPPIIEAKNYISVYSGENITKESSENLPFMAIIENMKAARPQSGLSDADIIFETVAEGGIPRFMALFQSKISKSIGPIRSDRQYFNELAESYDLPFAHCGGYQAALDDIKSKHLMSLNEMINGAYYKRSHSRKAPHNLYTSSDKLTQLINKKDYNKAPNFNISFDNSYWQTDSSNVANNITLKLSGYYTTAYSYKNGIYYKTMNNTKVPDYNTGKQLSAVNVIVQITRITPIVGDKKGRVNVKLTGSGEGYVFSNGVYKKMKWEKSSEQSQTRLLDENGNDIKLSAGNTWWEIIDRNNKIKIK